MLPVRIVAYISVARDMDTIKSNIESKVETYINSIAPGEDLEIGKLNKIGVNENNVNYFSVAQLYVDDKEIQELSIVQLLESKFLFDEIVWNEVEV